MDLALTIILLWGLLFAPIGIVLHWLVLGEGSSVRALPLAPVTGIALATVALAALGRFGIPAGKTWIVVVIAAISVLCSILVWRKEIPWRSRELIGAGLLLLFSIALIQIAVVGSNGDGPLGYGTIADPVREVAAIDAAAGGPAGDLAIARKAVTTRDERSIGFEQFAALTVSLGMGDKPEATEATWTAYGLHAVITGMIAALITLPLFAFARARGVRWLGLTVLVPLGVLAPAIFVALANGEGAAVASVPFITAAVFSLLTTRRDRGWWALVVIFGAAAAASAGPIAIVPLLVIGTTWMLLRSDTYEHLSQHDAPLNPIRTWAIVSCVLVLGVAATLPVILSGGQQLEWTQLHERFWDALRSWPFSWLDSNLAVIGPAGAVEIAMWLVGPALLAVAVIYAVVRNERRELGVLVGAIVAGSVAAIMALIEPRAGIRLFEYTVLALSPFLAALAIRAVALARENAESDSDRRFAGTGPTIIVVAFVVLSFAATSVTGSRMVHAPAMSTIAGVSSASGETTSSSRSALVAAGDPWLAFIVDGERVKGEYADADAVSEERNDFAQHGTRITGYDKVLLSSSPLSSDPSLRYMESSSLDDYQVRLFQDTLAQPGITEEDRVDSARVLQRARSQSADRNVKADPSDLREVRSRFTIASRHTPVEGDKNVPADRAAGLLLPGASIDTCSPSDALRDRSTCEPSEPIVGKSCSKTDVNVVRAHDDRARNGGERLSNLQHQDNSTQVLSIPRDDQLPVRPALLGVECFYVPLDSDASVLMLHTRDVGFIFSPRDATSTKSWEFDGRYGVPGSKVDPVLGGQMRSASVRGASLTWGADRLSGGLSYDFVLEGSFGAGVEISTGLAAKSGAGANDVAVIPGAQLGLARGSADGMSSILRDGPLTGSVSISNAAGTVVRIGRMFVRPRDMPRSCDLLMPLDQGIQSQIRVDVPSVDGTRSIERPGLVAAITELKDNSEKERVAKVAVASYMTRFGLPRYTLLDWVEQYEDSVSVEGCDGAVHSAGGESAARKQAATVTPQQLRKLAAAASAKKP